MKRLKTMWLSLVVAAGAAGFAMSAPSVSGDVIVHIGPKQYGDNGKLGQRQRHTTASALLWRMQVHEASAASRSTPGDLCGLSLRPRRLKAFCSCRQKAFNR